MQTVVIVVHLMIVATLIATVLLQKSEGGGLGVGGGAGFMSSRGTANLLTRTTAVLAVGFFITSLLLSWLASYNRAPSSISLAVAAGRRGCADRPADQRRHSGFAEEVRSAAAESAGPDRSAGAAVAIKRGGYARRRLASCISNPHQCADNTLDFTPPTA
jgi:preprotein translocase subunit SecG